jgi:ribosomal-protein-alanine N-acetyltransferase
VSPDVVLKFEGGYIRPIIITDIHDGYVNGINDPEVNRYLDRVKQSKQTYQSISEFVIANDKSPSAVLWGIWLDDFEEFCGTVRLHEIEFQHLTAHIGICLFDKTIWGRGFGKRAILAATKWAFDVLKLRWIEAGAYKDNLASQKTFLSAGYSWKYDINGKYILEGKPSIVKIYAAEKRSW